MRERLTYWKCTYCHGTGYTLLGPIGVQHAEPCFSCDGTGNAMVDGAAASHARQVAEALKRD